MKKYEIETIKEKLVDQFVLNQVINKKIIF